MTNWIEPKVFAARHKDEEVRAASRSGGIFTALSGKDKDITNTKKSDIKDNYSQGITQEDMPVETQTENQNDYTGEE